MKRFLRASVLALAFAGSPVWAQGSGSATIDAIVKRGEVLCGTSGVTPGFSLPDSQGVMRGLDADRCRTVAAAILGDARRTRFVITTTQNRFTILQGGEIDVLTRAVTWTLGREGNLGLSFAGINFYDGTGFLVKATSGITSARQLDGAAVCVAPGSSTELAVADYFRQHNMKFNPVLIQDTAEIRGAYLAGRCDTYSTDASGLAGYRFIQGDRAGEHVLLPEVVSKEPLGVMVRKGDAKFFDLVRWTMFVGLIAEEHGLSQANVDQALASNVPEIRRLLGLEGDMGRALGVDNRFGYNIIKQVGSYADMWQRNIVPVGIPRGLNRLWNQGGLHYAPPLR